MELKIPDFPKTPPIGLAVTAVGPGDVRTASELHTCLVVPAEVLQAIGQYLGQIQAMRNAARQSPRSDPWFIASSYAGAKTKAPPAMSVIRASLLLDDFLDKLDKVRAFLRLGKIGGLLVGLRPLAVLEQGDASQGLVETPQKAFSRTSLTTLARLLRLAGAFFTAAFGSAPGVPPCRSPHATLCDSISYEPCFLPKGSQSIKPTILADLGRLARATRGRLASGLEQDTIGLLGYPRSGGSGANTPCLTSRSKTSG